jgi:hypothetical protein
MADYSEQWGDYQKAKESGLLAVVGIIPMRLLSLLLGKVWGTSRALNSLSAESDWLRLQYA